MSAPRAPRIAFCVATMVPAPEIPSPLYSFTRCSATGLLPGQILFMRNTPEDNLGVVGSYQYLYEHTDAEILIYAHDDVICNEEGWDTRVLKEFDDPDVGVVGFGGALDHGTSDIYKTPYRLQQLARNRYLSNVADAEVHGARFKESCDVAVLDGFVLVVRRELLHRAGGWPRVPGGFHCYDYAICALARRLGYRCRVVGARVNHLGGRTSTGAEYNQWVQKELSMTDQEVHARSHKWFYDEFRDVMPWSVTGPRQGEVGK